MTCGGYLRLAVARVALALEGAEVAVELVELVHQHVLARGRAVARRAHLSYVGRRIDSSAEWPLEPVRSGHNASTEGSIGDALLNADGKAAWWASLWFIWAGLAWFIPFEP